MREAESSVRREGVVNHLASLERFVLSMKFTSILMSFMIHERSRLPWPSFLARTCLWFTCALHSKRKCLTDSVGLSSPGTTPKCASCPFDLSTFHTNHVVYTEGTSFFKDIRSITINGGTFVQLSNVTKYYYLDSELILGLFPKFYYCLNFRREKWPVYHIG